MLHRVRAPKRLRINVFGFTPKADRCLLVGMVHLLPLPGSPIWAGDMQAILDASLRDAELLLEGGCDVLLVENMGDLPYLRGSVAPETIAAQAIATARVVGLGAPTGVQILAAANREALGVALAAGASFIRAEAFAFAHVADEGWIDASAGPLLRARKGLDANIAVWADVQKKHAAHAVTADLSLENLARGAEFCGADALIITGKETGHATDVSHVERAKAANLPVVVGSGVTPDNAGILAQVADALIVGSYFKEQGDWRRRVDRSRVEAVRAVLG